MQKSLFAWLTRAIARGLLESIADFLHGLRAIERHSYRTSQKMEELSIHLVGEEKYRSVRGDVKRSRSHESFLEIEAGLPIAIRILRARLDGLVASFCIICLFTTACLGLSVVYWGPQNVDWWMLLPPAVYFAAVILDVRLLQAGVQRGTYGGSEFEAREIAAYVVAETTGGNGEGGPRRNTRLFDEAVREREADRAPAGIPGTASPLAMLQHHCGERGQAL